ncbi:hypothetical protein K2173_026307 [Erythroxylum novogranatense]|uniref:Beta-glucosidase 11-like n=1 Tax=Erythroxylum novogranatense TaxID=1862640 RepID=A0AAV8SC91_9ROSI|nr:hypothetical protein K2173_026307 [Erythroxylum novogranatense]
MWKLHLFLVLLLISLALFICCACTDEYSRHEFPPGFVFGAATSAYQVEGAANLDGRSPSIWDTFTRQGNMHGDTADVSVDGYHKYKEDVQLMAETGLDAYRFSISWSRLMPNGRGPINPKGLEYYNNLINELVSHGIQPHATLYHYDHPQILEDEYGGWVDRKMVRDFTAFADVCFREFGDRVSHWATINEPNIFAFGGYDTGGLPPKRCSPPFGFNCSAGNSSSEPYLAAHHMLLAHASTARLYRTKYQSKQKGYVGITLFAFWFSPLTNSTEDITAIERAKDFFLGWFAKPLVFGDYPDIVKENVGSRLPAFTAGESELVKGSFDFLGLIHYRIFYIKDRSSVPNPKQRDFFIDAGVELIFSSSNEFAFQYPIMTWGLQGVLEYFKQHYGNPPIFIHENGQVTPWNSSLEDRSRVKYLHAYIGTVLEAIRNGSDMRGYFVWSLLDVFELLQGFESSFGLYYVDLKDPELKRQPKLSARWYSEFLKGKMINLSAILELESTLFPHSRGVAYQFTEL